MADCDNGDGNEERGGDAESWNRSGEPFQCAGEVFRLRTGGRVGEAACNFQGAERDDEGGDSQEDADGSVEKTRQGTDRNGEQAGGWKGPSPIGQGDPEDCA